MRSLFEMKMTLFAVQNLLFLVFLSSCGSVPPLYNINSRETRAELGSVLAFPYTQAPMPHGDWRKLIERTERGSQTDGSPSSVYNTEGPYILLKDQKIVKFILMETNNGQVGQGFTSTECINPSPSASVYFRTTDGRVVNNINCLQASIRRFGRPNRQSSIAYEAFYDAAVPYGGIEGTHVAIQITAAYNRNFLRYTVFFMPEREGVSFSGATNENLSLAQKIYVEDAITWAQKFRPLLVAGTKKEL